MQEGGRKVRYFVFAFGDFMTLGRQILNLSQMTFILYLIVIIFSNVHLSTAFKFQYSPKVFRKSFNTPQREVTPKLFWKKDDFLMKESIKETWRESWDNIIAPTLDKV